MVQFNVCRLEEEANTVQKLNIEKSTADTKLKEMEGQITVHEDNIGKVYVLYYNMIHCTCVHVHAFSVPFTYNALYIVIQCIHVHVHCDTVYTCTCTYGIIKHVQCVNIHLNMYMYIVN